MKRICTLFLLCIFLILLCNSSIVVSAAQEGIQLCLKSVIPSLLPFMILSAYIRKQLLGIDLPFMKPIQKICKIPDGAGILWILGILGGYPVGAQCINDAFNKGYITRDEGQRLLGFCCNCGPSFIFGIMGTIFASQMATWVLWLLQITSSILVGICLPQCKNPQNAGKIQNANQTDIFSACLGGMSKVCMWIILFRILLSMMEKTIILDSGSEYQIFLSGILELTNGCLLLREITKLGAQFVIACTLIAFGGICVLIQTSAVTKELGLGLYFPGKVAQALLCFLLSYILQFCIFPRDEWFTLPTFLFPVAGILLIVTLLYLRKKVVAIRINMLYNKTKTLQ